MEAFTIDERLNISKNIGVTRSGRGFSLQVGPGAQISVGNRDVDSTVLVENDQAYIHFCGLYQYKPSQYIITAPLPHIDYNKSPREQKADYYRFDHSALVLWETGDNGATIGEQYLAEVISQDSGNLLIIFNPGSIIQLQIKGRNKQLVWTGYQFYWE